MAKPTEFPRFGTDQTNETEPSSGQKDSGWADDQIPPAGYFNWLHRTNYDWTAWLDDVFADDDTTLTVSRDVSVTGGLDVAETFAMTGSITPAAISSDQDNYGPSGIDDAAILRQEVTSTQTAITGISGGFDGRVLVVTSTANSTFNLVLVHESGSSVAANRFTLPGAGNITIPAGGAVTLRYDGVDSRWYAMTQSL
jgi:hypothetical protein